jgi:hypothetical protein
MDFPRNATSQAKLFKYTSRPSRPISDYDLQFWGCLIWRIFNEIKGTKVYYSGECEQLCNIKNRSFVFPFVARNTVTNKI